MRRSRIVEFLVFFVVYLLILAVGIRNAQPWGFEAHKKITELAIDLILSADEFKGIEKSKLNSFKKFLLENKSIIIERSIEPDLARNEDKEEQYNHFIDIDRYGKYPFEELPRDKRKAIDKFGFETLQKNGLLPWRISDFTDSLTYSIARWDREKMLKYLSWLAHYVEDAHQPLHLTENYDGQLSNQPGIHSRFETELIRYMIRNEMLKFNISKLVNELSTGSVVKDKVNFAFNIVLESYKYLDEILNADTYAKSQIPPERLYRVEKREGRTRYIYSEEYYSIMSEKLSKVIHDRMSRTSINLALLWLTALAESSKYK